MGMLPWDNWIYDLDYRRKEVNDLHKQAVHYQDMIQSEIISLNDNLDDYKTLLAMNATLVLISNETKMTDLELKDFRADIAELEPPTHGIIAMDVLSFITEAVAASLLVNVFANLSKVAKNAIWSKLPGRSSVVAETELESISEGTFEAGMEIIDEATAETSGEVLAEGVTETAVKSATMGTLASTGIGIFAAVGIDAIFGAINGAKEKKELDKRINELTETLKLVKSFYKIVESKARDLKDNIVKEENRFLNIVTELRKQISEPIFDWRYETGIENLPQFIVAQHGAVRQYGLLPTLRSTYKNALERNPDVTKDLIIGAILITAPAEVTKELLEKYWDILAENSDLIKNAK